MKFHNAVITGACGGFGQALARQLLEQGASVALVGLNRAVLDTLHNEFPQRSRIYTPDVSDSAAMQACALDWMAAFGTPDLVIANAGVAGGFDTANAGELAFFRRTLEINLLGVPTTFQPFLQAMTQARRGTLVGVASVAGWRGMPGNGAYCASKAGLIAYLQSLRAEMRVFGLQVTTVSPGYMKTAMTAGNRFAMPGLMTPEAAAAILLRRTAAGVEHVVLPRRVGWLSTLLRLLPVRMMDKILLGQPRKPRPGEAGSTPVPGLNNNDKL